MRPPILIPCTLSVVALGVLGASMSLSAETPGQTAPPGAPPAESATQMADTVAAPAAVRDSEVRTVEVWLAGRPRAAQRYVDAISTPGSTTDHRYLSPLAYSRRFGPRPGQIRAVRASLLTAGFTGVRTSVDGDYVSATAPARGWRRARAVRRLVEAIDGRAPEPAMSVGVGRAERGPTSLRADVLAVTGLDTGGRPMTGERASAAAPRSSATRPGVCARYWGQQTRKLSPAFDGISRAGVAVCGYSADQIRSAYGLGSPRRRDTPTGTGETIALVQGDGAPFDMSRALTDYAIANGLPRPRRGQYRQEAAGGSSARACDHDSTPEASLDSEAAYAIAPGADQLMVDGNGCLDGDDGDEGLLDAELLPLTGRGPHPQASIESVSYFDAQSESRVPAPDRAVEHAIALRAAAEGVSLLFCSGDYKGVHLQASDPDVTAVGGTTLGIGAHGQRLFETGWSDGLARRPGTSGPWHSVGIPFGAGGGTSAIDAQPTYQQAVVPRSMALGRAGQLMRVVPDIAADADPETGMLTGQIEALPHGRSTGYKTSTSYGTSQSTPLVAGMIADAEQGQATPFGFLNPLLYSLAGSRAFHDVLPESAADPEVDRLSYSTRGLGGSGIVPPYLDLFDDQDHRFTDQVTSRGYDTMTGLGSPDGMAFIDALRAGSSPRRAGGA